MQEEIFENIDNFTQKLNDDSKRLQVIGSLGAIGGIIMAVIAAEGPLLEIVGLIAASTAAIISGLSLIKKQRRDILLHEIDIINQMEDLREQMTKLEIQKKLLEKHKIDLSKEEINEIKESVIKDELEKIEIAT